MYVYAISYQIPNLQSLFIVGFFYSSIHIKKEKHNFTGEAQFERMKQLCENGQHRAVPLTCSKNVTQHSD